MIRWCSLAVALSAIACGGVERSSATRTGSEPVRTASGDILRESVPALTPTRVDTLRDEQGEYFSPSFATVALTVAGNTVAIENDNKRLVLFDTSGRQLKAVGREGQGPGEFRYLHRLFVLPGDSIAVWDGHLRRVSFFDAGLKFDRTEQFPRWSFSGNSAPVGRLADGRWIARMTANGPFSFDKGARRVVDTTVLMVGASQETPVEFHGLRLREGVDVVFNDNLYTLRLAMLNSGAGAVCERGAVLADTGGVRELDAAGRVLRTYPLPRTGDTIRTAAERSAILKWELTGLELGAAGEQARALLEPMVSGFKVRMLQPAIDVDGQLWYGRNGLTQVPRSAADQVDTAGNAVVSIAFGWLYANTPISGHSAALMNYATDSTGTTVSVSHFPVRLTGNAKPSLGRCFASFEY